MKQPVRGGRGMRILTGAAHSALKYMICKVVAGTSAACLVHSSSVLSSTKVDMFVGSLSVATARAVNRSQVLASWNEKYRSTSPVAVDDCDYLSDFVDKKWRGNGRQRGALEIRK
jgi:hypothetical protein